LPSIQEKCQNKKISDSDYRTLQANFFQGKDQNEIDKEFEQIINYIPEEIMSNKNINLFSFIEQNYDYF
jgi:hypothetical protein